MITHQRIPSMRFFFRGWPRGVAMVAMVATSLKVTLGAVARHPGADVGYQAGRHGRGPCGSRPRTRRFHADARCTNPEPRLGGETTRSVSDHRWPPWPPWPPLGRDSQKKVWQLGGVGVLTSGHSPWIFFSTFLLGVAMVAMVATGQPSSGSSL